jgi:hypothetical protein
VTVGEIEMLPLGAPPVEKPLPTQLVALVLLQARSAEPPIGTALGVVVNVAETASITVTVTSSGVLVAPPAPLQVSEYTVVVVGETASTPETASEVSKWVPVQDVAFWLLHDSSVVPPSGKLRKSALRLAVTAGPTLMVCWAGALVAPPAPVQVTE